MQFPSKLLGIVKVKCIWAITHQYSTKLAAQAHLAYANEFHFPVKVSRKLPDIRIINHISAITHQNTTKFETQAFLDKDYKPKQKIYLYVQFSGKLQWNQA